VVSRRASATCSRWEPSRNRRRCGNVAFLRESSGRSHLRNADFPAADAWTDATLAKGDSLSRGSFVVGSFAQNLLALGA
jgi:hypothetical protein